MTQAAPQTTVPIGDVPGNSDAVRAIQPWARDLVGGDLDRLIRNCWTIDPARAREMISQSMPCRARSLELWELSRGHSSVRDRRVAHVPARLQFEILGQLAIAACAQENGAGEFVSSHVQREGWIGYEPAGADAVVAAEERLGIRLPPTYRNFLMASNGSGYMGHVDLLNFGALLLHAAGRLDID
ncbi:SMI1/KNR4 family protein [Nocardia sp. NPDC051052]|uniref:SMI1/KNR4 family protein n=1 Tax=Nocardia sp. NPDC051052 TaxID=3364322 RepID=UPI003795EC48